MTSVIENNGKDHTGDPCGRFAVDGLSPSCSPVSYSEVMKPECCSPSQQGTKLRSQGPMKPEAGNSAFSRSKEAPSLPHWMDPTRVPSQSGEKAPKAESPTQGPSTPLQVPLLPQQRPRESYTIISSASLAEAFQPIKSSWSSQIASRLLQASPNPIQDPVQKENVGSMSPSNMYSQRSSQSLHKGLSPLPVVHHRVKHPSLNRALATLGTPKTSLLNDDLQLLLHSKPAPAQPSKSNLSVSDSDQFVANARLGSCQKVEQHEYPVDPGLTLGFNSMQSPGVNKTPSGSRLRWEDGSRSGSHSGLSFTPRTPNDGGGFLQLSQGPSINEAAGTSEECGDRNGKGQCSSYQHADVEHRLTQLQEAFLPLRAEQSTNPVTDPLHGRPRKRMKRRMLDPTITSYEARERNLDMDEDRDSGSKCMVLEDPADSGNSYCPEGPSGTSPHSSREIISASEPKTMVVRKTPKRVHLNNFNFDLTMSKNHEAASVKNSQLLPHLMFTSSSSPTVGDVVNLEGRGLVDAQGNEAVLASNQGAHDGNKARNFPLESKLYTVPAYSPMPSLHQTFTAGEPSLPLSLNFSPRRSGPMASNSKPCTETPATEVEWGKSLALSATPAGTPAEMEATTLDSMPLNYQERFARLQAYLKKCDEDDQGDLLHALQSVSSAARSSHAVKLEQRVMWLTVEEGKEMARVKSLNVMGQRSNPRGQIEGCTPQGLRLPAFSTPTGLVHQQSVTSTPRMRMLVSSSTPASAHTATANFA